MNSENFCYWLQGFLEMTNTKSLDEAQTAMLKEHLQLVFKKVTSPTTLPFTQLGGTGIAMPPYLNKDIKSICATSNEYKPEIQYCGGGTNPDVMKNLKTYASC